ncbi:MAG: F0F1 ATP synthase subunit delta [Verrucomicrobiales bacterium]
MKVKKESLRAARLLLKAAMVSGRVDAGRVQEFARRIIDEKPRGYVQILDAFQRLLRLELEKHHANVESAQPLAPSTQESVLADLNKKFGGDLTSEFNVNPDLLAGMRIKVGSTIWDGSVSSRLEILRRQIGA